MKTKSEVLKLFAKNGNCEDIMCEECPYNKSSFCSIRNKLCKLGAEQMLKTLPRELDKSKILTSVTADQAKVGMRGYFGDSLSELQKDFKEKYIMELKEILNESNVLRFVTKYNVHYSLFYPIDEVEE